MAKSKESNGGKITRRKFIGGAAAAAASVPLLPKLGLASVPAKTAGRPL